MTVIDRFLRGQKQKIMLDGVFLYPAITDTRTAQMSGAPSFQGVDRSTNRPILNSDSARQYTLAKRVVGLGFIVQSVAFYCSKVYTLFLANTATPTGKPLGSFSGYDPCRNCGVSQNQVYFLLQ